MKKDLFRVATNLILFRETGVLDRELNLASIPYMGSPEGLRHCFVDLQSGCVAQMSFGGHHALNASDQVQKKLQEAIATDQELQDGLAGINITDD